MRPTDVPAGSNTPFEQIEMSRLDRSQPSASAHTDTHHAEKIFQAFRQKEAKTARDYEHQQAMRVSQHDTHVLNWPLAANLRYARQLLDLPADPQLAPPPKPSGLMRFFVEPEPVAHLDRVKKEVGALKGKMR